MSKALIAETLERQFKKQAPFLEAPGWNWKEPRQVDTPCLSCGSTAEIWCVYADSGGSTSFEDEFYHICLKCGHIEHKWEHGGSVGYEDHAYCPFCGYKWA